MGLEKHLTLDASAADFAIDMSNVMRTSPLLGDRPADLARFTGLVHGLIAYTKDESLQVYGVADWSLLRARDLSPNERSTLKRWYRRGLIEVLDVADDRLLELADHTGQRVVSRDNYMEYYRIYPWIAGNRDRFFQPIQLAGGVSVSPRIMPVPEEWEISRKEEESLLLAAGMYDRRTGAGVRRDLLGRLWRCPDPTCPMFGPGRTSGQPLPVYRSGAVRCPTHGRPLTDIGGNPRRVQVKIRIGGTVRARFVTPRGKDVRVGRAPGEEGVTLAPWLDAVGEAWISRAHVVLHWNGKALTATDISTNGTWVRRAGSPAMIKMMRGRPWRVRKGDELVLGHEIELIISGREFVFDGDATWDIDEAHLPAASQATMVRRRPYAGT